MKLSYFSVRICFTLIFILGMGNISANIGKVLITAGDVTVQRDKVIKLRRGSILLEKDIIITGKNGRAQLLMIDNAQITLRPSSELSFEDYQYTKPEAKNVVGSSKDSSMTISLLKGGFITISGAIGAGPDKSKYLVKTPIATIGIRGTHYGVRLCVIDCISPNGEIAPKGLYGGVVKGAIIVKNDAGEQMFGAEKFFHIASKDAPMNTLIGPPGFVFDTDIIDSTPVVQRSAGTKVETVPDGEVPVESGPDKGTAAPTTDESKPSETTPGDLELVEPKPAETPPSDPELADPKSAETTPSDPELADPTSAEAIVAAPELADPTPTDPILVNPVLSDPIDADVIFAEPISADPFELIPIGDVPIGALPPLGFPQIGTEIVISIIGANKIVVTKDGFDIFGHPVTIDNILYDFTDVYSLATAGVFESGSFSFVTMTPADSLLMLNDYELLQFYAISPNTNVGTLYNIGEAQNINVGYDPISGLSWGRWSGDFMTATAGGGSVTQIDLSNSSLHWLFDNFQSDQALPISGSASYTLTGNTDPTNNLGDVGILGTASFFVDFTNQTVINTLSIGINGSVWEASGSGVIVADTHWFNGVYDSVIIDSITSGESLSTGTGSFSGLFSSTVNSSGLPAGAGLVYTIQNSDTNPSEIVTGTLIFGAP